MLLLVRHSLYEAVPCLCSQLAIDFLSYPFPLPLRLVRVIVGTELKKNVAEDVGEWRDEGVGNETGCAVGSEEETRRRWNRACVV